MDGLIDIDTGRMDGWMDGSEVGQTTYSTCSRHRHRRTQHRPELAIENIPFMDGSMALMTID